MSALAHADREEEALWELSADQLADLDRRIETQIQLFSSLLQQAMLAEAQLPSEQRNYAFDFAEGGVSIPRSLTTRALMAAVDLELLEQERNIFCGRRCSHTHGKKALFTQHMGWWHRNWPKVKKIFKDNATEFIQAVSSRAKHKQAYWRFLRAEAAFKSQSYGSASMIVGAAATSVTFVGTEAVETFVLSFAGGIGAVLHFACKANYFFSVAVGTTVASLARDVKASYTFSSENAAWFQGLRNLRTIVKARRELNDIKSKTLVVEYEKARAKINRYTHEDAISETPESILKSSAFRPLALADDFLWAEILGFGKPSTETVSHESLESEFKEMLSSPKILLQWQDARSALSIVLNGIRVSRQALHIRENSQLNSLRSLGQLDLALRKFDFFMTLWLQKPVQRSDLKHSVLWLNGLYSEILALLITINRDGVVDSNRKDLEVRIASVAQNIEQSNREGAPTFYRLLGKTRLLDVLTKYSSGVSVCGGLF